LQSGDISSVTVSLDITGGFNLTFDDTAVNGDIHLYQQNAGYTLNWSGQLTGTWQAGRGKHGSTIRAIGV
jgi:hypothetical protein